jgi:hypothetical protein
MDEMMQEPQGEMMRELNEIEPEPQRAEESRGSLSRDNTIGRVSKMKDQ